jgi:hypothetical protein
MQDNVKEKKEKRFAGIDGSFDQTMGSEGGGHSYQQGYTDESLVHHPDQLSPITISRAVARAVADGFSPPSIPAMASILPCSSSTRKRVMIFPSFISLKT